MTVLESIKADGRAAPDNRKNYALSGGNGYRRHFNSAMNSKTSIAISKTASE